MKMFINRNDCHVFCGFPNSYYKIAANKSAINIVNWNYTIPTNIVKIRFPELNITAAIILSNSAIKSYLLMSCRQKSFNKN
jgi:hypothetical protein